MDDPSTWPAWVQAIGSILAIGVAIAVPAVQRMHERSDAERERKIKARSIALTIYTPLMEVKGKIKEVNELLIEYCKDGELLLVNQLYKEIRISVPEPLETASAELYLLRDVGADIQQVLALLGQYTRAVESFAPSLRAGDIMVGKGKLQALKPLSAQLSAIDHLLERAIEAIIPVHDGTD